MLTQRRLTNVTMAFLRNLRDHSQWVAFGLGFFIVAASLSLTAARPGAVTSEAAMAVGDSPSPDRCRECHQEEYEAWAGTIHAQASFDPIFQEYLQAVEQPGECFACHATGYDTATGQIVLAGVSCEACHGPYRSEHPEESMMIVPSEELCGTCHYSTLNEWRTSRHGQVGIDCVACHEVHTQKTRDAVVTNALCAGCHVAGTQDEIHAVHLAADVHCVDCHLSAAGVDDAGSAVSGHAVTGHSFTVAVSACTDCHAEGFSALLWGKDVPDRS